jgi:hypothetical protein
MNQTTTSFSLPSRQSPLKTMRVSIAAMLLACSGMLVLSASAFENVNMATTLSVEGGHLVVRWSTKGFDHYNIRWSENGGPVKQVEREGDKYFRYLTPFRPGVAYLVAVQGCDKPFAGKSQCTSWDEAFCGPAGSPCDGTQRPPPSTSSKPAADACASGYVWREARPTDHVCVTPASRDRVGQENRNASQRWDSAGAYGPKTCVQGYVWREAFQGDTVCVSPARRTEVKKENSLAASRRARP